MTNGRMIDQGIKSRPLYSPIRRDPAGRLHLLLADLPQLPDGAMADDPCDYDERWFVAAHSRAIPSPTPATDQAFRAAQHLLIALRHRLARETMGLRLYAIGREPFLWEVSAVADAAGMSPAEVRLFAHGSAARRVFCNHCRTITQGVTTNIVACAGCGAHLFVRDHFSRRLNAFAGVQVDAEVPGDLPEREILYP